MGVVCSFVLSLVYALRVRVISLLYLSALIRVTLLFANLQRAYVSSLFENRFTDLLLKKMMVAENSETVTCPFNVAHTIERRRLQTHIIMCKRVRNN